MSRLTRTTALFAGFAALAACAESPLTEPEPTFDRATVADLDPAYMATEAPVRHVVVFGRNGAPSHFERSVAQLGGTVELNHALGIAIVRGLDDASAASLRGRVGAEYVEEQAEFRLIEPAEVGEAVLNELTDGEVAPASPSDPTTARYYAAQWNMQQIQAPGAWSAGRLGSAEVTVAILDTGIDYLLPDLVGRVDLDRSASFEPLDDQYVQTYFPTRHLSTDLHYHGTNVATQVASNASRFAGVTSRTTLMSVKVCSVVGGCHGVIQGLLHAVDNGADVINMSLGGWFSKAAFPGNVVVYNRIMNYAHQQGVTIVVSAGNDGNDLDRQNNIAIKDRDGKILYRTHIPSFFSTYCDAAHVICVASTRRDDVPASYTNYGRSAIDVAAPGGGGGDWVYALCPQTSLVIPACQGGIYYLGVAGTSQAAPHVAGLAALAVEDVGRNPADVAAYIRDSADAIGGGNTPYYGKGRINVARAVGAY